MKTFTALTLDRAPTRLIPEGFAIGGFFFGAFWLFYKQAWIPGAFILLAQVLARFAAPSLTGGIIGFGLSLIVGLIGNDLRRWELERRGYRLSQVVAARDEDAALARLLAARPELIATIA